MNNAAEDVISHVISEADFDSLPSDSINEIKRRIIDSIGVARGALKSLPAKIAANTAKEYKGNALMLNGNRTSPDMAAFYNTLLIRYIDFNDTYLSKEPLHPSDMLGALFSVGSLKNVSLRDLFLPTALGYDISMKLCDSTSLREKGYEHVNFLQVGATAALSKMLNLSDAQTRNAISMTIIPHVALRESRVGALSMWKAGAAADASRVSVFASILARNGFTAPATPITGKMGFIKEIATDMRLKTRAFDPYAITHTFIKKYPVEYHAQVAVDLALRLARRVNWPDIKKIEIITYEAGKSILADSEKWDPTNKETADHSLPFIVCSALAHKDFWLENYLKLKDPATRKLMRLTKVYENSEYSKVYPTSLPTKIKIYTRKEVYEDKLDLPRGHWKNPMSNEELKAKFVRLGGAPKDFDDILKTDGKRVSSLAK
jgi:2-methylcitrate dehydratase